VWIPAVTPAYCKKKGWRVLACSVRTLRIRMTGDGESRGQPANPGLPGKMDVKICVLFTVGDSYLNTCSKTCELAVTWLVDVVKVLWSDNMCRKSLNCSTFWLSFSFAADVGTAVLGLVLILVFFYFYHTCRRPIRLFWRASPPTRTRKKQQEEKQDE